VRRYVVSGQYARVLLASALDYASIGWPVFCLHHPVEGRCSCGRNCDSPFKHPRTRHGLDDATTDPSTIQRLWGRWPWAGIGLVTGKRSGAVIFDVDGEEGFASWDALMADGREEIRRSFMVLTPGGGVHIYLAHPGWHVPNSAGKLASHIDVRGDGGYGVASPSRHGNGSSWRQLLKPGDGWAEGTARLAPMPGWVSPRPATVKPVARTELLRRAGGTSYARTALDAECGLVALAPVGQRNDTLNRAAFNLGTLIGAGEIDAEAVAERLLEAARRAGLGDEEAEATLASGLSKGMANPRKRAS
jgi:hypothetical protein